MTLITQLQNNAPYNNHIMSWLQLGRDGCRMEILASFLPIPNPGHGIQG